MVKVDDGTGRLSQDQAAHRTLLERIEEEAHRVTHNGALIASQIEELKIKGGKLDIQAQMNFLTGAHMRMMKDLGAIEHLQKRGVVQKPAPKK